MRIAVAVAYCRARESRKGARPLPRTLPYPPTYAKVNPADAPVLTLAISSDSVPLTEVQNLVNTRLAQKISQVTGVGLVTLAGGQRPAVRIQADTQALAANGIGLDTLRTAITAAPTPPERVGRRSCS